MTEQPNIDPLEFKALVEEFEYWKGVLDRVLLQKAEAQAKLLDYFESIHEVTGNVTYWDGRVLKATVVKSDREKYDDEGLEKALGSDLYATVSKRTIDKQLLEHAVTSGTVDFDMVRPFMTISSRSQYIKLTETLPEKHQEEVSGNA